MNTALPPLSIQTLIHRFDNVYSDQREHGYQGPPRHVRLARVTPAGGGLIAKSEDGTRCAVTGKECTLGLSSSSETISCGASAQNLARI